jgi:hypothetical protein
MENSFGQNITLLTYRAGYYKQVSNYGKSSNSKHPGHTTGHDNKDELFPIT